MTTEDNLSLKKAARVCLAALTVLLAGSVIFYRERMFFADAAFIIFSVLHAPGLYIQVNRYGSFVTQGSLYLGKVMHLPLKAILISYSASFNFFYLLTGVALYYMKQYRLVIVQCLYYFLFASQTYFWVSNEVHQAVSWMFLFFGVTLYAGARRVYFPLFILLFSALAFITVYTHFIIIIPAFFLWVYLMADRGLSFSRMRVTILTCVLIAIVACKYLFTSANSYDDVHLTGLRHLSVSDLWAAFSKKSVLIFLYRCVINYWCSIAVLALGLIFLMRSKKYLLTTWTLLSVAGYVAIMGLTYGDDNGIQLFHIESEWACLGIIVATGFVFECLPKLSTRMAALLVAGIIIVRMVYMGAAYPAFHNRLEVNEQIMTQMQQKGITKMGLINTQHIMEENRLFWAIPYETLMMSAIKGEKPQITFLLVNPDDKVAQKDIAGTRGYYTAFGRMTDELNKRYFAVDTSHNYVIMTYEELAAP